MYPVESSECSRSCAKSLEEEIKEVVEEEREELKQAESAGSQKHVEVGEAQTARWVCFCSFLLLFLCLALYFTIVMFSV